MLTKSILQEQITWNEVFCKTQELQSVMETHVGRALNKMAVQLATLSRFFRLILWYS